MNFIDEYKSKLRTAEEAVSVVKSGDWIDYTSSLGMPVLLDRALAKRRDELKDVKFWIKAVDSCGNERISKQNDTLGQNNNTGIEDARYQETLGNVGIDTSALLSNVPEAVDGVTGKPIC